MGGARRARKGSLRSFTMNKFAHVLFPIPIRTSFTYEIPGPLLETVRPGVRVLVNFGFRKKVGFVSQVNSICTLPNVKPVLEVLDPDISLSESMLSFARWMAKYYMCSEGEALDIFFPPLVDSKKTEGVIITDFGRDFLEKAGTASLDDTGEVLKKIEKSSPITKRRISGFLKKRGLSPAFLDLLIKKGLVQVRTDILVKKVKESGFEDVAADPFVPIPLSAAQQEAFSKVGRSIERREYQTFLLHGVTGSGKSEVYLKCTELAVGLGRQVIILVPEIGLTYQMVKRFYGRFGKKISIIHSALTPVKKFNEWKRIRRGEVSVVIGARSAIVQVAVYRGLQEKAVVLLGSATPSLESHYNVLKKKYTKISLPERVDNRMLPREEVIDMKGTPGSRLISETLQFKMEERTKLGEQSLLFLNRRGSSTFVYCVSCGFVWSCKNCDISLTYYKQKESLSCHYCGFETVRKTSCPSCEGTKIEYKGFGTQKIEEEVKKLFPASRVVRIDRDSTVKKGELEALLSRIRKGEVDVVVGTQMISKGHDFPNITLVGILSPDNMANIPDFRAGEKTFQQIVQVAGRGGRGEKKGEVFAQTYKPEHYAIKLALVHNISEFYVHELSLRKELNYPPFSRLVCLRFEGSLEVKVNSESQRVKQLLQKAFLGQSKIEILGPARAVLYKIQNRFRVQLLIKSEDSSRARKVVREALSSVCGQTTSSKKGVRIVVDVDPFNML
ncbi:MAG: primosomal protein N' [Nitrospinota bacterium]